MLSLMGIRSGGVVLFLIRLIWPVALLYPIYLIRGLGAGDIKCFAVLSVILGSRLALSVIIYSLIIGAVIGLCRWILRGQLKGRMYGMYASLCHVFHRKRRETAFYYLHFFCIGRMSIEGGVKVTKQSIVVCDSDEAYVRAFAAYLMECLSDVTIVSFTSEEAFLASEAVYSIGILSKDFLSVLEFSGKEMVREKFYLCDEVIASEYEHLPMVYKYQSMEIVEEMLKRLQ